jgi:hypothetical protein
LPARAINCRHCPIRGKNIAPAVILRVLFMLFAVFLFLVCTHFTFRIDAHHACVFHGRHMLVQYVSVLLHEGFTLLRLR